MRVSDETVYNLLSDHALADLFGTTQQLREIRAQIDAIGDFEKLEKRYEKLVHRICHLRSARDTTITIIHEGGSETIMNRLEYDRERGWVTDKDERLIKMARL